jgi:hypothetical protein
MSMAGYNSEADFTPLEAYRWQAPGKDTTIVIDFDVVDRLGAEVQRGLRSVQRDVVEVGGILLGSRVSSDADEDVYTIEDFEAAPCSYANGPEYRLAGEDFRRFQKSVQRWGQSAGAHLKPIGFYRGDRGGLVLEPRDRDLLERCFPPGEAIALLAKPSETRPAQAALFFSEDGQFPTDRSYREFPLRREELGGGKVTEDLEVPVKGRTIRSEFAGGLNDGSDSQPFDNASGEAGAPVPPPTDETVVPKRTLRLRGGWVWVPLSFIFLLMGTVLGFQVALSVRSKVVDTPIANPYALQLTATPSAESVHLRWDRDSPAVQKAQRGRLVIEEDGRTKNVDLDAGHLRNGSVIRLELLLEDRVTVSQSVDFTPVVAQPVAGQGG